MEKTRIEVYKRKGDFWSIRVFVQGVVDTPEDVWRTLDDATNAALALAEQRFREKRESVDIYREESGRFVLYTKGFRHFV